jgi:hypothetical protein
MTLHMIKPRKYIGSYKNQIILHFDRFSSNVYSSLTIEKISFMLNFIIFLNFIISLSIKYFFEFKENKKVLPWNKVKSQANSPAIWSYFHISFHLNWFKMKPGKYIAYTISSDCWRYPP